MVVANICIHIAGTDTVDGNWGPWRTGPCNVTCGIGYLFRTRKCNNPTPATGGKYCVGPSIEWQLCNAGCCPSIKLCILHVHSYMKLAHLQRTG